MGFQRVKEYVSSAIDGGCYSIYSFRKIPSQATTAGVWCDLSMAAGNPPAQYYASEPLVAATLLGRKGIYHNDAVYPKTKHLSRIMSITSTANAVPSVLKLCDYLLYYPLVDMDSTDQQDMDNTVTLPRYSTGFGVKMMAVATAPFTGGATLSISYTNSDGISGRTTSVVSITGAGNMGSLIHGGVLANSTGPFIPLQSGDNGVRSIEQVTFNSPNGGLCSLVLVKPLCDTIMREITAFLELMESQ